MRDRNPIELSFGALEGPRARRQSARHRRPRASVAGGGHPADALAVRAIAILTGLALAVVAYGIAASREGVAVVGLALLAVAGAALTLGAHAALRALERRCERLGRARAESERARHDLEVENAELARRNASLVKELDAISDGFEYMDAQTAGRLRALLEAAGCDLAELTDFVLDDSEEA